MQQIQDPIYIDPDTGIVTPGMLIRTQAEIETYLGQAMMRYFDSVWENVSGSRRDFINVLPELFASQELTFEVLETVVDLSLVSGFLDVFDVCDSYIGGLQVEAWNPVHLTEALSGYNPFYVGTATKLGMIYQKPNLYLFPVTKTATLVFTFYLQYIKLPVNPLTGAFFIINGDYDIPFSIAHITEIADIATRLFKTDDMQASVVNE